MSEKALSSFIPSSDGQLEETKNQEEISNQEAETIKEPVAIETEPETKVVNTVKGDIEVPVDELRESKMPASSFGNLFAYTNKLDEQVEAAKEIRAEHDEKVEAIERSAKKFKQEEPEYVDDVTETVSNNNVETKKEIVNVVYQENHDLSKINVNRKSKNGILDFLARKKDTSPKTRVILPLSGYVAHMSGMTSPEIRDFNNELNGFGDPFSRTKYQYEIVFSKLNGPLKDAGFKAFLKQTTLIEFEILLYGIVCSSYPDATEFNLMCENKKCATQKYTQSFRTSDYLTLKDDMSDYLKRTIELLKGFDIDPVSILEKAPSLMSIREELSSGLLLDLGQPTLYDYLYNVLDPMQKLDIDDSNSSLLVFVTNMFVPLEDGTYDRVTEITDKLELLKYMDEEDEVQLGKSIESITDQNKVVFKLSGFTCPECGHELPEEVVSMESMLFLTRQNRLMKASLKGHTN